MHTNEDDLAFIEAIRQAPYDDAPRLVYADWLEERDDSRFEYIRKMYEIIGHIRAGTSYEHLDLHFRELAERYSQEWRNVVSKRFEVILESLDEAEIRTVLKAVRLVTGYGFTEAAATVRSLPSIVRDGLPLEMALGDKRELITFERGNPKPGKRYYWPPQFQDRVMTKVSICEMASSGSRLPNRWGS